MTEQKSENRVEDVSAETEKDNAETSTTRRKALKIIAGSISAVSAYHAFPHTWKKPLIEQFFLPAHAATSAGAIALDDTCNLSVVSGTTLTSSVTIQAAGFVTPPTGGLTAQINVTPVGAGNSVSGTTTTLADGTFSLLLTITGGPNITGANVQFSVTGATGVNSCTIAIPGGTTTTTTTPTPTTSA